MIVEVPASREPDDLPGWKVTVGLAVLGALFVGALVAPIVVWCVFGTLAAVLAGIAIPVAWVCLLPNSCMNGGFLFAILAVAQFLAGCTWFVVGLVLIVVALV